MSRAKAFTEKRAKAALAAIDRELDTGGDNIDFDGLLKNDLKAAAMGKGDEELFEKKLSKEEKKALAKAKREAKKKDKVKKGKDGGGGDDDSDEEKKEGDGPPAAALAKASLNDGDGIDPTSDEAKHEAALEELSRQNIVVTYEQRKGNLHANTRDIKVTGVNVAFHGKLLVEETEVVINYGNRYGFIGPNGSGKVRERGSFDLLAFFYFSSMQSSPKSRLAAKSIT
jgi:ATP-binding cassette subfamily F protein 2